MPRSWLAHNQHLYEEAVLYAFQEPDGCCDLLHCSTKNVWIVEVTEKTHDLLSKSC